MNGHGATSDERPSRRLPADVERKGDNTPIAYRPPLPDGRLKGPSVKKKGGPTCGGPQPVEDLASPAELVRGRPQM